MLRFRELFFRKSDFYPFELGILEVVISRIDDEKALKLKRQIEAVNFIQRHRGGKEVNFYRMQNGKSIFDDQLLFTNAPDEELLARVRLRSPSKGASLKTEIWMAGGRIFSLEFDKSPKEFFSGISLNDVRAEIAEIVICENYSS